MNGSSTAYSATAGPVSPNEDDFENNGGRHRRRDRTLQWAIDHAKGSRDRGVGAVCGWRESASIERNTPTH